MRRRTMGAFAIPVIAIVAIVIAAQVFSTGSTTTKQPVGDAATANPGSAQTTPDADANGEPGQEPDADANGDTGEPLHASKYGSGDPDYAQAPGGDADSNETTVGEGPLGGFEAYLAGQRTYPATEIPPALPGKAATTFEKIAGQDAKSGDPNGKGHQWKLYGPTENATQPGVTAFSGATNNTASRTTALVVSPTCGSSGGCRVWAGVSGGGVWRTDNALVPDPNWKQLKPDSLDQNSVGALTLDPTDPNGNTIYLGTGEGHRCSSGCEAGVGIYKSTNGGEKWTKLGDACVSNGTYPCATPGTDAFLGRGINSIVIDPTNANHIFVGSAQGVRGLSHVIGNGGTSRLEPGANLPGLYESTDGGATFTMIWDGTKPDNIGGVQQSFGVTDVGLDPLDSNVVYVAAFDAGLWRRDAGAASTAFNQVFAPQFNQGAGIDRLMIAPTIKNGHTRIYLTEGTQNAAGISGALASNFWRLDNANQTAAALLASQAAGATPRTQPRTRSRRPSPAGRT